MCVASVRFAGLSVFVCAVCDLLCDVVRFVCVLFVYVGMCGVYCA